LPPTSSGCWVRRLAGSATDSPGNRSPSAA
jgi:hypothetical protein